MVLPRFHPGLKKRLLPGANKKLRQMPQSRILWLLTVIVLQIPVGAVFGHMQVFWLGVFPFRSPSRHIIQWQVEPLSKTKRLQRRVRAGFSPASLLAIYWRCYTDRFCYVGTRVRPRDSNAEIQVKSSIDNIQNM